MIAREVGSASLSTVKVPTMRFLGVGDLPASAPGGR